MQKSIHFTSVSGSLRKGSFINTRLLHSPAGLLMKLLTTVRILFDSRPIYQANPDLTKSKERSAARITFRNKLAATDALVISSTRYNYSIRDGLKNFMDWLPGRRFPIIQKRCISDGITRDVHIVLAISQYETGIKTRLLLEKEKIDASNLKERTKEIAGKSLTT